MTEKEQFVMVQRCDCLCNTRILNATTYESAVDEVLGELKIEIMPLWRALEIASGPKPLPPHIRYFMTKVGKE